MLTRALSVRLRPRLAATCAAASCDRGRCTYASAAPDVEDAQPKVTRSPSSSPAEAAAKGAAAMAATIPTILQPRVLIYDGVCHLCHRGVKWVIKADKYAKIKFCCLQSKAAEPYLRLVGMDREDVLRRVLFIEGPEAYYEGSTALLKVASYLPLPYSVLSSLLIVPVPLRDAIYDYIAKHRYDWLGKDDECIVIENKELLERFIDRDELLGGAHGDGFF